MREEIVLAVETSPRDADVALLAQGLTDHSLGFVAERGFNPIAVFARDSRGAVVGGASGQLNWNWLQIALVWVSEKRRGSGLGNELMDRIEAEGRARGCTHAHLDTFSYQARGFYEKRGYEVFATLEDYPTGHRRFFLKKVLG